MIIHWQFQKTIRRYNYAIMLLLLFFSPECLDVVTAPSKCLRSTVGWLYLKPKRLLSSTRWTACFFSAWTSPNLSQYIGPHPRVSNIVRRWTRGVKSISDIYQLRKLNFADYSQSRQRKQCTRVNDDTPKDTTTTFWSSPEYLNELNVQYQKSAWHAAVNSQSVM